MRECFHQLITRVYVVIILTSDGASVASNVGLNFFLYPNVRLKKKKKEKSNKILEYLYSGKSLNEGRSATQNPAVLGIRIKRRSLRPLLLRPVEGDREIRERQ